MLLMKACRYLDEMHNLFVFWMFKDLKKLDFKSCKIFTSLTQEIFGVR